MQFIVPPNHMYSLPMPMKRLGRIALVSAAQAPQRTETPVQAVQGLATPLVVATDV